MAENLGVKNAAWDRADGYAVPRDCYNSYFYVVEDENTNAADKFVLHGKRATQYLDGGSALHLNLEDRLDQEGFYNLFCLSAKTGCNYFCTNVLVTLCDDCGHIGKDTTDKCVKCNSTNIDHATRVIGYLKRVTSFANKRQEEHGRRYYHITKDQE